MPEKLNVKIGDARIGTQPLYLFGGLNRKQPTMLALPSLTMSILDL